MATLLDPRYKLVLDNNQILYARLLQYLNENDSGEDDNATTESEYLSSNMSFVEAEHDDNDDKRMIPKNIHCQVGSIIERMWSLSMCYSY